MFKGNLQKKKKMMKMMHVKCKLFKEKINRMNQNFSNEKRGKSKTKIPG